MKRVCAVALGSLFSAHPALASGRSTKIERLVEDNAFEDARTRCDKWSAVEADAEPALREACARAWWPVAAREDSVGAWSGFRERWGDTQVAKKALGREAEAALRDLPLNAGETAFLLLADRYAATPYGEDLRRRAADAAVQTARSPEQAVDVARRYPAAQGLAGLVERFPAAFLKVVVEGRKVSIHLDPPVALPPGQEPKARWVAKGGEGRLPDWDEAVGADLVADGIPPARIEARIAEEGGLPFCVLPGRPADFGPALELTVGSASHVLDQPWDPSCGPEALPVFLTLGNGSPVGLSLAPDHRIDLPGAAGFSSPLLLLVKPGVGEAAVVSGQVWRPTDGGLWLVQAVEGGAPWLSPAALPSGAVPLTDQIGGSDLPRGWRLLPTADGYMVDGPSLRGERWSITRGQVRVLAPMLQAMLGLTAAAARPASAAPSLSPLTPFSLDGAGVALPRPPAGASPAGIYQGDDASRAQILSALFRVGVEASRVNLIDSWKADLDSDKVPELLMRGQIDMRGVVVLVDPEGTGAPRVFVFDDPRTSQPGQEVPTPFTFRQGEHVYMAWSGLEPSDGGYQPYLVSVRAVGRSFALDGGPLGGAR